MKNKTDINLRKLDLKFEENGFTYHILMFKRDKMNIEVAIFQNDKFIKNAIKPFAQIPKSLKIKLNPLK